MIDDIVVIRGGGDLATGVASKLHNSGFKVLILEVQIPLAIRRTVSFAQAVFDGSTIVEGICCIKANNLVEIYKIWDDGNIPIIVDENCHCLKEVKGDILVDAIMAKRNLGTFKEMAPITIAIGPGFEAGIDVDVVIETHRGHDLGRLILKGFALEDTGIPGDIMGFGKERVIKAHWDGIIKNTSKIGDIVIGGQIIGKIDTEPVKATIDGVLRGQIMNGIMVKKGLKIADIDPRGVTEHCYTISDKARAIGGGVLEAVLFMKKAKGI